MNDIPPEPIIHRSIQVLEAQPAVGVGVGWGPGGTGGGSDSGGVLDFGDQNDTVLFILLDDF